MDVVSEFGGGSGAVAQCLSYEWVNVAQNSTVRRSKLEEMIIWIKQKWLIAGVLKLSDLAMPLLHKDIVSEAWLKWM